VKAMMAVIKMLAALVMMAVLGATVWLVSELRSEAVVPRLEAVEVTGEGAPLVDPGELAFERAAELLAMAEVEEAREKLEFVVGVYPGSASAGEARRILGELNLDELLSTDVMDGKLVHEVERGDTFLGIAARYETTLDCIMHLNNLQRMDRLYPGDELVVMPLNFNVRVDVERRLLNLMREGRFLKVYELADVRVREGARGTVHTIVEQKMGMVGDEMVAVMHEGYRSAEKVLTLARTGLQIREVADVSEEEPGRGIYLRGPQMEELALLLRVGNEVEIRYGGN